MNLFQKIFKRLGRARDATSTPQRARVVHRCATPYSQAGGVVTLVGPFAIIDESGTREFEDPQEYLREMGVGGNSGFRFVARKVIALVGPPVVGKDTVAIHLERMGFEHFSSGDVLRSEMSERNLPLDRASMRIFSTAKKQELGNDFIIRLILSKIIGHSVISGLRAVAEIELLRHTFGPNFLLIALEADIGRRYEFAQKRGREGDYIPFEEFRKQEEAEYNSASGAQQVGAVIGSADVHIQNTGTIDELYAKVDKVLDGLDI